MYLKNEHGGVTPVLHFKMYCTSLYNKNQITFNTSHVNSNHFHLVASTKLPLRNGDFFPAIMMYTNTWKLANEGRTEEQNYRFEAPLLTNLEIA